MSSKLEFEAELVAACALIPLPVLASRSAGEIEDEFGYLPEMMPEPYKTRMTRSLALP